MANIAVYAIKQEDKRFAKHPRFAFFIFNRIMRQRVREKSTFYVNKNKDDVPATVEELRAAFEGDTPEGRLLLNSLCRAAFSITGTRPYWMCRRNELESYVNALGCPDLFLTFSAADY